jgi:hypothetical protein
VVGEDPIPKRVEYNRIILDRKVFLERNTDDDSLVNARAKSKSARETEEVTDRLAILRLVQQQSGGGNSKAVAVRNPREVDVFGPQTQLSLLLSQREVLRTEIDHSRKRLEQLKATLAMVDEQIGALAKTSGFEGRHPEESLFALLRAAG